MEEDDTATHLGPLIISEDKSDDDSGFDIKNTPPKIIAVSTNPQKQQVANPKINRRFNPDSGMWNIGDVILGIYEVRPISQNEPFSEGGAGIVNRIYHREWDMELAVKSPKPHVFQTESGKLNYENEARTWIELGLHPNIVTCYLVRRISDIPRLFAEFVKDGSLKQWILDGRLYQGGTTAALLRILNIAIQSAWGIAHAHSQKLLHLDIKPANIMMDGQIAKVTDFGLAQGMSNFNLSTQQTTNQPPLPTAPSQNIDPKYTQSNTSQYLTSTDSTLPTLNTTAANQQQQQKQQNKDDSRQNRLTAGGMTPGFCSPEQFLSFECLKTQNFTNLPQITIQSDIWSWGVSVLAMFHGRAPCKKGGQTARRVLEIYLKETTESERPLMPDPVAELLFECFEAEPAKRPASMNEIAERLTKIYKDISGVVFPRSKPISTTWTPETINNRAASMLDLDKPAEAKKLLDQAAILQPWHPEVTYNQTLLAWRNAELTDLQTIEKLEALVNARNQDANAIYALALAQRERGNLKIAINEIGKAIEIEPRTEYQRAFAAIEKIITKTTRCVERIQITPGLENKILVDSRGEYILLENLANNTNNQITQNNNNQTTENTNVHHFDILKSSTGQLWHKFIPTKANHDLKRIAISDDLHWELVPAAESAAAKSDTNNTAEINAANAANTAPKTTTDQFQITLRRIGAKNNEAKFSVIKWSPNLSPVAPTTNSSPVLQQNLVVGKICSGQVTGDRVVLRNNSTGNESGTLIGHEGAITALAFSADGRFAITGGADHSIRLWEVQTLRCLRSFTSIGGTANAVYFDKNNAFALSLVSGGVIRIWDISILCGETPFHAPLLLSSITSAEEAGRRETEMKRLCDSIREAVRGIDYAGAISFVERASRLSGWEAARKRLELEGIWDKISRHTERKTFAGAIRASHFTGHLDTISAVTISLDGKLAASAGRDTTIRIWNVPDQRIVGVLEGHFDWVRSIEMTLDSRFLVSGSWDCSVRVWNIATGQCMRVTDEKIKLINSIAINPYGRTIAIANGQGRVYFWDVLTDKMTGSFLAGNGSVSSVKFSRNGSYLVTGCEDGSVSIWKLVGGSGITSVGNLPIKTMNSHKSPVTDVIISADMSKVISADHDGRIFVWDIAGDSTWEVGQTHLSEVTGLAFISDGRFFLSCSRDTKIRIHDIKERTLIGEIEHSAQILSMSIDISGNRFVTGGDDAVVRVWNLYWNYQFPGWSDMTPEAINMIKILLSLYSNNNSNNTAQTTQKLNTTIIKRIIREMEYRGFGFIKPKEIKNQIITEYNK
ncbi:MAG: protein kinase [Planctomycetaceae bacterium]|nr:protein kinase [Planctomycetaceae bacterium]